MEVTLELKSGILPIKIYSNENGVYKIEMQQQKPKFLGTIDLSEIQEMLNLPSGSFYQNLPFQIVSMGTPQLMIPIKNISDMDLIEVNLNKLAKLKHKYNFFSVHVFSPNGFTQNGDTYARHFDNPPDLLEDPFTGSATGGMASYMWKYNLINEREFVAEQGHHMTRPGSAIVSVSGERDSIQGVCVAGNVVFVGEGKMIPPDL